METLGRVSFSLSCAGMWYYSALEQSLKHEIKTISDSISFMSFQSTHPNRAIWSANMAIPCKGSSHFNCFWIIHKAEEMNRRVMKTFPKIQEFPWPSAGMMFFPSLAATPDQLGWASLWITASPTKALKDSCLLPAQCSLPLWGLTGFQI